VYIINPYHCDFIKIGKWKSSLKLLQGRYQTYYGKHIDVFVYEVQNYDEMEILLKDKLSDYTLDPRCELLKKSYLKHYQSVFKHHCKTDYVCCKQTPNTNSLRIQKVPYKIIVHQNILKLFDISSLDDLLDKEIDRYYLSGISEHMDNIFKITCKGQLVRNRSQSTNQQPGIRRCCEELNSIIKVFHFTFKKGKRKKKIIDGEQIDITSFHFFKN
jgi:hypothetical protein